MKRSTILALALVACASMGRLTAETNQELAQQVRATETAFAATMAARDHAAFTSFLADEAVFFGGRTVQRGKVAVAAAWKRFF
ncbi:MAG TPA: DUF4440 domain-containing protein, partial [Verrucomicrobiae bacterium]|nr:DUF4440 domain-containing protein [Verrucomicrobiae bacterium]